MGVISKIITLSVKTTTINIYYVLKNLDVLQVHYFYHFNQLIFTEQKRGICWF